MSILGTLLVLVLGVLLGGLMERLAPTIHSYFMYAVDLLVDGIASVKEKVDTKVVDADPEKPEDTPPKA